MYSINKSTSMLLRNPQVNKESSGFQPNFWLMCCCRVAHASQVSLCKSNLVEVGGCENWTDITRTYLTMHALTFIPSAQHWLAKAMIFIRES